MTPPPPVTGSIRLLVNTKSRRGGEWFERTEAALREKGLELEMARSFTEVPELIEAVKDGIAKGVPLIACGGGDGTFSAVAGLFREGESVLGVLPLGTGNAFARDLGIVADVDTAVAVLTEGKDVRIDLGEIDGDIFVNVATMGLTTRIARNLTDGEKKRFGRFVYAIALYRAMSTVKPFLARLTTENGMREFETLQTVIGVGRFHAGPLPLSETATITDGHLTVYALQAANKSAFLKMALMLPFGRQGELAEVHSEECLGGRLETFPPVSITVDGEVKPVTPVDFNILPGAIRVRVPQTFAG